MISETMIQFSVNDDLHRKAFIDTLSLITAKVLPGYEEKALSRQAMITETGDKTPEQYEKGLLTLKQNLTLIKMSLGDAVRVLDEAEPTVLALRNETINRALSGLLKQLDDADNAVLYEWKKGSWQFKDAFVALTRQLLNALQKPFTGEEIEEVKQLELAKFFLTLKLTDVKPELARLITLSACRGLKTPNAVWDSLAKRQAFLEAFFSSEDSALRDQLIESNLVTSRRIALVQSAKDGLSEDDRELLNRITDDLYPSVFEALGKADIVLTNDKDRQAAGTEALAQFDLIRKGLQRILDREADVVLSGLKAQTDLIRGLLLTTEDEEELSDPALYELS